MCFFTGDGPLVMRIHAYLDRFGFINFGVFKRLKPLPGKAATMRCMLNASA